MNWGSKSSNSDECNYPSNNAVTRPKALKGWTTLKGDGSSNCRLILHRSLLARITLTLGIIAFSIFLFRSISSLSLNFTRYDHIFSAPRRELIYTIIVATPALLGIVNTIRRRTVLSSHGIEMRGLIFTERRPWPATISGLDILSLNLENNGHGGIDRSRLAVVNGATDDLIRMPGCIIRWSSKNPRNSRDNAIAARRAIWSFAVKRGWVTPDSRDDQPRPDLAQVRRSPGNTGKERDVLTYRSPAWRTIKEILCRGRFLFIFTGLIISLAGISSLLAQKDIFFNLIMLLAGVCLTGFPIFEITTYFRKTKVTKSAIRTGGRVVPWPRSRSSVYVAGDRVFLVDQGKGVPLHGTSATWGSFQRRQRKALARCEEIWRWGLAHGATCESGEYVPLNDEGMQSERELFERRAGIACT